MSGWEWLAVACPAAAVWAVQLPRSDTGQLRDQMGAGAEPAAPDRRRAPPPAGLSPVLRGLTAVAAGLAVVLTVPGPLGWLAGLGVGAGLGRWLARQPSRLEVEGRAELRRQLPLALELMAAALAAGATNVAALVLAAGGTGPPLSRCLLDVASSLRLGAAAEEAWEPLLAEPALQRLGRLAVRSTASGSAMAGACRELADQARESLSVDAQVAIKRAGVLAVLPLALCFLPAFVLVGVVPIVVGLLKSLAL